MYNGNHFQYWATNTDEIPEGSTNLYYTTSRANSAIDARVNKAFIDTLNVDADTLDGLDSSVFATSAQGDLADTALLGEKRYPKVINDQQWS